MKTSNLLMILLVLLSFSAAAQWDDCSREEVNCTGLCGSFIDKDNNGYCDHSEPAPEDREAAAQPLQETPFNQIETEQISSLELITGQELKTKTVQEVSDLYNIDSLLFSEKISEYLNVKVKPTDSFQFLHDNYGAEPSKIKGIADALKTNKDIETVTLKETAKKKPYVLWEIVFISVGIYLTSFIMAKKKVFSITLHKKIWNILLFCSFFISAFLGMLLVIRINDGLNIQLPFNILFWHVEAGIALFLIAIFHIAWHLDYFKALLRSKEK